MNLHGCRTDCLLEGTASYFLIFHPMEIAPVVEQIRLTGHGTMGPSISRFPGAECLARYRKSSWDVRGVFLREGEKQKTWKPLTLGYVVK